MSTNLKKRLLAMVLTILMLVTTAMPVAFAGALTVSGSQTEEQTVEPERTWKLSEAGDVLELYAGYTEYSYCDMNTIHEGSRYSSKRHWGLNDAWNQYLWRTTSDSKKKKAFTFQETSYFLTYYEDAKANKVKERREFTVKFYDHLTIQTVKNGVSVEQTVVNVLRENGTYRFYVASPSQDEILKVDGATATERVTDQGIEYQVEMSKADKTVTVTYTQDTSSNITTSGQNVSFEGTSSKVSSGDAGAIQIAPDEGYFISTYGVTAGMDAMGLSRMQWNNGVLTGSITAPDSKCSIVVSAKGEQVFALAAPCSIGYNHKMSGDAIKRGVLELFASNEALRQGSLKVMYQKNDGSSWAELTGEAVPEALVWKEQNCDRARVKVSYLDPTGRYPMAESQVLTVDLVNNLPSMAMTLHDGELSYGYGQGEGVCFDGTAVLSAMGFQVASGERVLAGDLSAPGLALAIGLWGQENGEELTTITQPGTYQVVVTYVNEDYREGRLEQTGMLTVTDKRPRTAVSLSAEKTFYLGGVKNQAGETWASAYTVEQLFDALQPKVGDKALSFSDAVSVKIDGVPVEKDTVVNQKKEYTMSVSYAGQECYGGQAVGETTFTLASGIPAVTLQAQNGTICCTDADTAYGAADILEAVAAKVQTQPADGGSSFLVDAVQGDYTITVKQGETLVELPICGQDMFGTYQVTVAFKKAGYQEPASITKELTIQDGRAVPSLSMKNATVDYETYKGWTEEEIRSEILRAMDVSVMLEAGVLGTDRIQLYLVNGESREVLTSKTQLNTGEAHVICALCPETNRESAVSAMATLTVEAQPGPSTVDLSQVQNLSVAAKAGDGTELQVVNHKVTVPYGQTVTLKFQVTDGENYYLPAEAQASVQVNGETSTAYALDGGQCITLTNTTTGEKSILVALEAVEKEASAIVVRDGEILISDLTRIQETVEGELCNENGELDHTKVMEKLQIRLDGIGGMDQISVTVHGTPVAALGEYPVTLSYAGNETTKPCSASAYLRVVDDRKPATLRLKSNVVLSYVGVDITPEEIIAAVLDEEASTPDIRQAVSLLPLAEQGTKGIEQVEVDGSSFPVPMYLQTVFGAGNYKVKLQVSTAGNWYRETEAPVEVQFTVLENRGAMEDPQETEEQEASSGNSNEPKEPKQETPKEEPNEPKEPEREPTGEEPNEPKEPEQEPTGEEPNEPKVPEQEPPGEEPNELEQPGDDPGEAQELEPDEPEEEAPVSDQFTDLHEGDWYYDGVSYCIRAGLMEGFPDGTFRPGAEEDEASYATRAQVITVLWRIAGAPVVEETLDFTDVPEDGWYLPQLRWAVKNQVVQGHPDGTFRPDEKITRQELAVVLWRCFREETWTEGQELSAVRGLKDYDEIHSWALESMDWACARGLFIGFEDGTLRPQNYTTRAQLAVILHRYLNC